MFEALSLKHQIFICWFALGGFYLSWQVGRWLGRYIFAPAICFLIDAYHDPKLISQCVRKPFVWFRERFL